MWSSFVKSQEVHVIIFEGTDLLIFHGIFFLKLLFYGHGVTLGDTTSSLFITLVLKVLYFCDVCVENVNVQSLKHDCIGTI